METADIYRQLGKRIREVREKIGITRGRLSSNAKISPSFLFHVEQGTKKASLLTIKKIAGALEVPVQSLFCPPKEPIAYLKNDRDLFLHRLEGLVRNKDEDFKKLLWKIAEYLAKKDG